MAAAAAQASSTAELACVHVEAARCWQALLRCLLTRVSISNDKFLEFLRDGDLRLWIELLAACVNASEAGARGIFAGERAPLWQRWLVCPAWPTQQSTPP